MDNFMPYLPGSNEWYKEHTAEELQIIEERKRYLLSFSDFAAATELSIPDRYERLRLLRQQLAMQQYQRKQRDVIVQPRQNFEATRGFKDKPVSFNRPPWHEKE